MLKATVHDPSHFVTVGEGAELQSTEPGIKQRSPFASTSNSANPLASETSSSERKSPAQSVNESLDTAHKASEVWSTASRLPPPNEARVQKVFP